MRKIDEAYEYIKKYIEEKNYPPTIREIKNAINIKSTSTIAYYLKKLEEDNKILKGSYKNRSIQLIEHIQSRLDSSKLITMPLVGTISAGYPLMAEQNITDRFLFSNSLFTGVDMFLLRVKGDSMINAGIRNGDLVVVSRQNVARNGEIVVALIEGEATVKRIYKEVSLFRLQPENPNYSPIYAERLLILGKVVGVIRTDVK